MQKFLYLNTFLVLLLGHSLVLAEELVTKSINLNYRQAEDVISLLRPFLHPDGAMTADGYRILVKTSPKNYQDLQQLVAEIDVSMRQLRVSVTIDRDLVNRENQVQSEEELAAATTSRQYATGKKKKASVTQQVNVIEGKWANISTGESVPVGQRIRNPDGTVTESVTYKSIQSSLQVLPRINGERVTLFIRPQISNQTGAAGRSQSRSAETTISGQLNQWLLIGGTPSINVNQPGSRIYTTQAREDSGNQMYVKVEVIQ